MPRKLLLLILFLCPLAQAEFYDYDQLDQLYTREDSGLRFYKAEQYDEAFNILSDTAVTGLKYSQYILGHMYLQGNGVEKNILTGLTWIGLAAEVRNKTWQRDFKRLYSVLSLRQRQVLDQNIEKYRAMYGASVQGITCSERPLTGQRRLTFVCHKREGFYIEYPIIEMPPE